MKRITLIAYFVFIVSFVFGQALTDDNSVLSSGRWYKIGIVKKGIYKLDKNFFFQKRIPIETINPQNIKIYGNGGNGVLPQKNNIPRPIDLRENSLFVSGEEDGIFNDEDYILFFGNTADKYEYSKQCNCYTFEKHNYSDTVFYFLTFDGRKGKRLALNLTMQGNFPITNSYDDFIVIKEEKKNLVGSGRTWVGERMPGNKEKKTYSISGSFLPNQTITLISTALGTLAIPSRLHISVNGIQIYQQSLTSILFEDYGEQASVNTDTIRVSSNDGFTRDAISVQYELMIEGTTARTFWFIESITLEGKKSLTLSDSSLFFRNKESAQNNTRTYTISKNNNIPYTIWEITEFTNPKNQQYTLENNTIVFSYKTDTVREFVAFHNEAVLYPPFIKSIATQNIKMGESPEFLIITHPLFKKEADRLADFRRQNDNMTVKVVTVEEIYNQFSSGMQDVTALRDYIYYLYHKEKKLKYVLLFGGATYDYKQKDPQAYNKNFVPLYESRNFTNNIYSYSSEDYYGFLEPEEGEWIEDNYGDHTLEIGIGRIPVINPSEAKTVVDKIIAYTSNVSNTGDWKNKMVLIADDGDANIFLDGAERMFDILDEKNPEIQIQKVYLDAFKQIKIDKDTEKSKQAEDRIAEIGTNGALIINYIGHGSPNQITDEDIANKQTFAQWNSGYKLPVIITATCDFGVYDQPKVISAAEELLKKPNGGAIALFTTTRPVYSNTNEKFNEQFVKYLFKKENNKYLRLGDIMKYTKNGSLSGPINRNFTLLGDPSMQLNLPKYSVQLNSIKNQTNQTNRTVDTFAVLNTVTFEGTIINENNQIQNNYNGELFINIYDQKNTLTTLGDQSQPTTYKVWESLLFRGSSTIKKGSFTFSFVIPKNISYKTKSSRVNLFAKPDSGNQEAIGATSQFFTGGSLQKSPTDNTPPLVQIFINDSSFVSRQTVNPTPLFIIKFFDENGISLSKNSIGQAITATLQNETFDINEYYYADRDTYKKGTALYPIISPLKNGEYTFSVTAWDTHNNKGTATITFRVDDTHQIKIQQFVCFPNPASNKVNFKFLHDRNNHFLSITLSFIDMNGKTNASQTYNTSGNSGFISDIVFERYKTTKPLFQGVYIYEVLVVDTEDETSAKIYGRIHFNE